MTPKDYYHQLIATGNIIADPQQEFVVEKLNALYLQLISQAPAKGFAQKFRRLISRIPAAKGFYIWGSVGAGKTFLMNSFYDCLPFDEKLRIHFHAFMQIIHDQLKTTQGEKYPLQKIAQELAKRYKIICFDELSVTDIADAMLLAELFKALFAENMIFIFTSNTAPDNLYKKGLQRQRFLPAIELIKKYTETLHVDIKQDYRLGRRKNKQQEQLERTFSALTKDMQVHITPLQIHGRNVRVEKYANGVVWFDFLALCGIPRSQKDYLELVKQFHTVIVSDIPKISATQTDLARAFINLIDVLYDANIKLYVSSVPIDEIYEQGRLSNEFARTRSRLHEMVG